MLDNKGRHEAERLLGESDHAAAIVILPDGASPTVAVFTKKA